MNFPETEQFTLADVYVRVSSEDQQERETIKNQIEFAEKYCDLHKIKIREFYKDDGVTGTIPLESRPEGNRLIEDVKNGRSAKLLLIYNMKRLGRKARVTLDAIYQLEKYGVTVRSMTEPFDTGTPVGRFVITVLAGQAELDRDTTLEVMWHGANRAAKEGKWLGGIVPYGYFVNSEKHLEINEDPLPGKEDMSEAFVVRLMYDLVANQKMSTIQVAEYFNALKIPPSYVKDGRKIKKGKRKVNTAGIWRPSRIGNMIKNTTYKGIHYYGKRTNKDRELIQREVPALVDEDTWERAQKVLKEKHIEAKRNAKREYLLRGLIKCGICGSNYCGRVYNSGSKRELTRFYVCNGKHPLRGSLNGKCTNKNLKSDWIEEIVWKDCLNFISNPQKVLIELKNNVTRNETKIESYESELKLIRKAIDGKETEKNNILELYRKGIITTHDVESQLLAIQQEKLELERREKELKHILDTDLDKAKSLENIENFLLDISQTIATQPPSFEIKRKIVTTLVEKIVVTPDPDDPKGKKYSVSIKYIFDRKKAADVDRTVVRAVNNYGLIIEKTIIHSNNRISV